MTIAIIEATRGSDIRLIMTWSLDGNPVSLVGWTVAILDAAPAISSRITSSIVDAENGVFSVFIEGTSPIERGLHSFRVQKNKAGFDSVATPLIGVRVS